MNHFLIKFIFQRSTLITFGVCTSVFLIYILTMPRELSWGYMKLGIDSPELLTASNLFGIAHPPGYPGYTLLLGSILNLLPFFDPPLLGNIFSIFCFVLAIPFLIGLITNISKTIYPDLDLIVAHLCSSSAIFILAFAPLIWGISTITEVYTLNILAASIILFSLTTLLFSKNKSYFFEASRICLLSIGISIGLLNHLTILGLFIPVAFLLAYCNGIRKFVNWWFLIPLLFIPIGYSYLVVRSGTDFPSNWGNPSDFEGFLWLIRATPYQEYFKYPWEEFSWNRIFFPFRILFTQIGVVSLFISCIGIRSLWLEHRPLAITLLIVSGIFAGYSICYVTIDTQVNLIPLLVVNTIFIAIGFIQIFRVINRIIANDLGSLLITARKHPQIIVLVFFAIPAYSLITNYDSLNFSRESEAYDRGQAILQLGEDNSIYLLSTEEDVFTSWYVRYVEETSTKKIPIAVPLLQYDWYLENNLAEFGLSNLPFADINQLASHIINRALKDGRQVFIGDANLYDEVKSDETHNNLHLIEW